jgi:hypothetical protein
MTYTSEDVLKMDVNEIVQLIERKTGKPVTASFGVWLAMAHGSARGGGSLTVIDLNKGETRNEGPDYEALAELFNKPDVPKIPRPEFSMRIPDPDHFLKTYDMAQKIGGETFERFKRDVLTLILWAMREYRDTLNIYPDFCEDSFYWTMMQDGRVAFNGGLIKHSEGWSIHT